MVAALLALPVLSFGYIDGGSGSMLLQAAVSGLLGLAFVARNVWATIRRPRSSRSVEPNE